MLNYGFKIAPDGGNLQTLQEKDLAYDSARNTFKYSKWINLPVAFPGSGDITTYGVQYSVLHHLGYSPSFDIWAVYNDGSLKFPPADEIGAYSDNTGIYISGQSSTIIALIVLIGADDLADIYS